MNKEQFEKHLDNLVDIATRYHGSEALRDVLARELMEILFGEEEE